MKNFAKLASGIAVALALMALNASAQISLTGGTMSYSENFDSMGSAGTTTPTGWFGATVAAATGPNTTATNGTIGAANTVVVDNGSGTSGAIKNYGTAAASDRALGSLASSNNTRLFEVRFTNNTGLEITSLTLSYDGEQWRDGGNTANIDELGFVFSTDGTSYSPVTTAFNFVSPQNATVAATLDGNAAANRVTGIGGVISSLSIADGTSFYLRWVDPDNTGSDNGLAIDDFSMSYTTIPEPSTVMLVGAGLVGLLALRRRRS